MLYCDEVSVSTDFLLADAIGIFGYEPTRRLRDVTEPFSDVVFGQRDGTHTLRVGAERVHTRFSAATAFAPHSRAVRGFLDVEGIHGPRLIGLAVKALSHIIINDKFLCRSCDVRAVISSSKHLI